MAITIQRRQPNSAGELPAHLHPVLQKILLNRNIEQAAQLDLSVKSLPAPTMAGTSAAVELLKHAIYQQDKILIVGDFDADGATSTALSILALKMMGAVNVDFLVPNRFDFGYGLSEPLVDLAAEQGAKLIMTVDNGISCCAGVAKAKAYGIKVVVTDHHLPGDVLPDADAIVNPNQVECEFPSKNLAGVGVAFYLMLALRSQLRTDGYFANNSLPEPNLAELLDLVALGTVADVVPLDQTNRVLVQQGLNRIRQGVCRPGIKAMLAVANRELRNTVSSDFGFVLGPRLNAAGRLDDMTLGISCLLSDDFSQASMAAARLDELNKERREIETGMQAEALAIIERTAIADDLSGICLFDETWHQGVIGIVAGRIKEKYYRPTVVFAEGDNDELKGSCRSINGFHIRDALEYIDTRHSGLIKKFGGHAMAAGLSIAKADYASFKRAFETTVTELIDHSRLQNIVFSDGELAASDMSVDTANLLKAAMPWGQGFEEPIFDNEFMVINERVLKDKHLKLVVQHQSGMSYDAIWFNYDNRLWSGQSVKHIRLAYSLDTNTFRGKTSVQLMVKALELI